MSVGFSISKAVSAPKKKRLACGVYVSVIISVAYAAEYIEGEAIELNYTLTAADGSTYPYREIFFNHAGNERTRKFFAYLEEHGIPLDALETLVGVKERLNLKKSTRGRFLTIESREFLSSSGDA